MARCKLCDSRIKQHDRSPAQQLIRVNQLRDELRELQPNVGEEFEIKAEAYESLATLEHTARQSMYLCGLRADFKSLSGRRAIKARIIKKCL